MVATGDVEAVEDMTGLAELTEESILRNLAARYEKQLIYTYTGSILVGLNPYKSMPIYDKENIQAHIGKRMSEKPPHIFAISEAAIANCRQFKQNQAVIISGESGAGKTESTKVILQYLTVVSSQGDDSKSWIEQQILEANTVLESFGNAKTVRNNNSSRFGKFVQVLFDSRCQIIGASIVNYLLEKSRVVRQARSERNYHVFYEMVAGANAEEKQKLKLLGSFDAYHYLNQSGCLDIPGVNDKKHFEDLKLALTVLKMTRDDLDVVFKIVSSILHLGNVNFVFQEAKDGVEVPPADAQTVNTISELLQVDSAKLTSALCFRKLTVRNESTLVPLKLDQATDNRDSIAKTIYDKLFNYLIEFINTSTATKEVTANFIGVLDIFGFELFEVNSFEQLCINYTNEKLQQFFNQFIFKLEQEEYARESISYESVDYKDNQPCLDLIESKVGVLGMLDEECRVPKGTDETFVNKLHETNAKNEYYVKPRTQKGCFGIKHYAGEVIYQVNGFLDKNRDAIQDEIYELFTASKYPLLQKLFKRADAGAADKSSGQKKTAGTAGANFKNQLSTLVTTLGATTPHYVRCIKPNWEKKAFVFDDTLVIAQLRYSGMLETIRIRKSGFPTRLTYELFNERYRFLTKGVTGDGKKVASAIMSNAGIDKALWQLGRTKAFMKQQALNVLTDKNDVIRGKMVVIVQKVVRGHMCYQRYKRTRQSAVFLQKYLKMFVYRERYKKLRKCTIKAQAVIRGWFARDYLKQLKADKKAEQEAERKAKADAEKAALLAEQANMSADQAAAAAQRLRELEQEERQSEARKINEQRDLAANAAKINAKNEKAGDGLDNLFSFLDDFEDGAKKPVVAKPLLPVMMDDFDDIFNLDAVIEPVTKKAPVPILKQSESIPTALDAPGMQGKSTSMAQLNEKEKPKAMRANPLAKKMAEATEASKEREDREDYSLRAFAEKYFEKHQVGKGGTLNTLRKLKVAVKFDEMLCYTKSPLPAAMLAAVSSSENKVVGQTAVDMWKVLNKVIEPGAKRPDELLSATRSLLEVGIKFADLRDELYVQLCRQMSPGSTPPKGWDEIKTNGWQLMALFCSTFPPSKLFAKHLLHFLASCFKEEGKDVAPLKKLSDYCEQTVRKLMIGGSRKIAPSTIEIIAIRTQVPLNARVRLLDGRIKALPVASSLTATELVKDMAGRIDLRDATGWALYEVHEDPWEECMIKGSEYVSDILAFWALDSDNAAVAATSNKKQKAAVVELPVLGDGDSRLYVKKRIFRNVNDIPVDPVEFNLLYAQACSDVLHDIYPVTDKLALQFASLQAQVDGDVDPARPFDVKMFIPRSLQANQTADQWAKGVRELQTKLTGKTPMQARLLYLQSLKQFPYYGSTLFPAKFKGFWQHPENIILAISSVGVGILLKNKTVVDSFNYMEIQGWEVDGGDVISISVIRKMAASKMNDKVEVFKFQNRLADDISSLMKDYSPKIGIDKRKDRDLFVPESEVAMYFKDLDKARVTLLKKNALVVPTAAAPAPNLATMFAPPSADPPKKSRKLSSSSKSPSMQSITAPVLPAAPPFDPKKFDWVSLMTHSTFPLLVMEKSENQANYNMGIAMIHNNLLELLASAKVGSLEAILIANISGPIQVILQKANDMKPIVDEVYMQMAKFTTEKISHLDAKTRIYAWRLFASLCAFAKPTSHDVLEFVRAHLKFCSVIDERSPRNPLRRQEALFAKYCYKALQKTQMSDRVRLTTPSQDEIKFTSKMMQVYSRFYTPDGQFRALMFDPWSTAEDIVNTMKSRMQMDQVDGLALYNVNEIVKTQSYIQPRERISEIMAQWDVKHMHAGAAKDSFKFLLKKRLFLNADSESSNAGEEAFSLQQVIEDIHAHRIPLEKDDAVYLMALLMQMEHGDASEDKKIDYTSAIETKLPKLMHAEQLKETLPTEHQSLRGKSSQVCQRLFMQRLRSWPLFGSTVYDVKQSYSSALPTDCWLAVGQRGVFILPARSKTPTFSYEFKKLETFVPADDSIMIVVQEEESSQQTKHVLETKEGGQIVDLIRDYMELQA